VLEALEFHGHHAPTRIRRVHPRRGRWNGEADKETTPVNSTDTIALRAYCSPNRADQELSPERAQIREPVNAREPSDGNLATKARMRLNEGRTSPSTRSYGPSAAICASVQLVISDMSL